MDQKLPSERLTAPSRRVPWTIAGVLAAAVVGSAIAFGPAVAAQFAPAPTPTATAAPADTGPVFTADELASIQQAATDQQTTITDEKQKAADAAAAAQAAADAAAAKPSHRSTAIAAGAPGSLVPFIASTDPNNANGGDYEDPGTYCDSHSASGNPPVCD